MINNSSKKIDLDFLSKMTLTQFPNVGFFVKNSRIRVNKLFSVDLSDSNITKINSIHTWLSCGRLGCPAANGSNNISKEREDDMKFWVYLQRDGTLDPPFSPEGPLSSKFKIHYDVEGPCKSNV